MKRAHREFGFASEMRSIGGVHEPGNSALTRTPDLPSEATEFVCGRRRHNVVSSSQVGSRS
jgi:hypothetical protein